MNACVREIGKYVKITKARGGSGREAVEESRCEGSGGSEGQLEEGM